MIKNLTTGTCFSKGKHVYRLTDYEKHGNRLCLNIDKHTCHYFCPKTEYVKKYEITYDYEVRKVDIKVSNLRYGDCFLHGQSVMVKTNIEDNGYCLCVDIENAKTRFINSNYETNYLYVPIWSLS